MIIICTAMYLEAEPFIEKYNLKKDTTISKFQVFENEDITLLITGIGKMKAAIALTYLLSKMNISKNDFLINIGLCGSKDESIKIGQPFICNKILDGDSKRTYFTDLIFKQPFEEMSIETSSLVVNSHEDIECQLVDMESSGIYESAITFMEPHQILFIKVVSDYLNSNDINITGLKDLIYKNSETIIPWLDQLRNDFICNNDVLSPKEIELIDQVSKNMKFTASMKSEFKQLLKYYSLTKGDISDIITETVKLKCSSKKEGKMYLDEFKEKFI